MQARQPGSATSRRIRVAIVDDHALLRQSLSALLSTRPEVEIVGEYEDGRQLLDGVRGVEPEVVLMDIAMPVLNGIEATKQLRRDAPHVRVIMVAAHVDADQLRDSLRAGAGGYVLKRSDIDELVLAITLAAKGNQYFSQSITERYDIPRLMFEARQARTSGASTLTDRERPVLQLLVDGHTLSEIARALFVSPKTVEGHKASVYRKLAVNNRAELVRETLQRHLLPSDMDLQPQADPQLGLRFEGER